MEAMLTHIYTLLHKFVANTISNFRQLFNNLLQNFRTFFATVGKAIYRSNRSSGAQ